MSLYDLYDGGADFFSGRPFPTSPRTFDETLDLSFEASKQRWGNAQPKAFFEAYEAEIDRVRELTGEVLPNPAAREAGRMTDSEESSEAYRARVESLRRRYPDYRQPPSHRVGPIPSPPPRESWDDAMARLRDQNPGLAESFRTSEQIETGAIEEAARLQREFQAVADVADAWSSVALFAGELGAGVVDPINFALLPLGLAGAGGRTALGAIGRAAAQESALSATAQAVSEFTNVEWYERIGAPSNPWANIAFAAGGGAILGGGVRALGEGLRVLGQRRRLSADTAAAQRVFEREAMDQAVAADPDQLDLGILAVREGRSAPASAAAAAPGERVTPIAGERVFTGAGRAVDVEYQLVEASQLITSQTDDGAANAAFPRELQPRDRARAASQAQIQDISANLQPERLGPSADAATGAPLIGPDNVVESGNARVLAARRAYREVPERARAYRDYLEAQGFDTARYQEPILIRRRTSALTPEQREALTVEAQRSGTLELSGSEKAAIAARGLDDIMPLYRGGAIDAAANRDFVRAFVRGLPSGEAGGFTTAGGQLSAEGRRALEGALLVRAYGDAAPDLIRRLIDSDDTNIKAIAGALQDVAGGWALMRSAAARGEINPAMDVTPDVFAAVQMVERARRDKTPLHVLAEQGEMFGAGMTDLSRAWLMSFFREGDFRKAAGRGRIVERMNGYLEEAMKTRPGSDMFGQPAVSPTEVMTLFEAEPARNATAARRLDDAVAAAARADDATVLEAQRLAAESDPDVAVPLLDDAGNEVGYRTVKASELLDEADRQAAQLAEAAGCMVGAAAT